MRDDAEQARRMRFLLALRQAGVTDARVLGVMEQVDRAHYAPPSFASLAQEDRPLPLAEGQQMTPPSMVARMIAALNVAPSHQVLEIGTGSAFATAILAGLARRVVSVERRRAILSYARERLGTARIMHAFVHLGDGHAGWTSDAPYDRIIVWGALQDVPAALQAQLSAGGVIVAPQQQELGAQRILRLEKESPETWRTRLLETSAFGLLEEGVAEAL